MKPNTMYWLGIRHVGSAATPVECQELAAKEITRVITQFIIETSLATRIEFIIGRTQNEVLARLNDIRGTTSSDVFADADAMWDELCNEIDNATKEN